MAIDPGRSGQHRRATAWRSTREGVRGIDRTGGTILHTSRADPRTQPEGDRTGHVLNVLERLGIDAMVTLGGDGTLRFSAHLARAGRAGHLRAQDDGQ